jgi:sugar/nucleoside kinase (ribokinase family)
MAPLHLKAGDCRYRAMLGAGGIGSGVFFALAGNHTLGREESRSGRFLDRRDYCKLHIIAHYVQTLLGPDFTTLPIGKVGDDEAGRRLVEEMKAAGMDMRYVEVCPGERTLASFCLIYPDGSGGNLTVDDSACDKVDAACVGQAEPEFARFAGHGIALAAPEVPLAARRKLLELGTAYRFLRVASFVSAEMQAAVETGLLSETDLLGINLDEAAALAGTPASGEQLETPASGRPPVEVVEAAVEKLRALNPAMLVSITAGKQGSWSWDGTSLAHVPAWPAEVVSTAGAGDAHLAGIIAGLAAGLAMAQAHELGALVAALSITSPHTIAPEVERQSLRALADRLRIPLSDAVGSLLK